MKVQDCIGCGFCCIKAKCGAGVRLYGGGKGICPALIWNGERHVCDLMELPGDLGRTYRTELFAGLGCCSNLNSWRREDLADRTKPPVVFNPVNHIPPIMQKFLKCVGREFISTDSIILMIYGLKGELIADGIEEHEASAIANECLRRIREQRSSMTKAFMG